jgi:sialate O-acetylesterase
LPRAIPFREQDGSVGQSNEIGQMSFFRKLIAAAPATLAAACASADVKLPAIFSDGAVLQRGAPIPVWGWASPGETVTARLAGQTRVALTTPDGRWRVTFAALKATPDPVTMSVSGTNRIEIRNVRVGEVWVCSGQSNMQWTVRQSEDAVRFIRDAIDADVRMFTVERRAADSPQADCIGKWEEATPATVPNFSAVGYHFALNLRKALGVPIGMINTSFGGTPAEAWTPESALSSSPTLSSLLANRSDPRVAAQNRSCGLWNAMVFPIVPYRIRGAVWYQGESNVGRAEQYRALFPAMIGAWRKAWAQGDFPFYFVQIAPFRYGNAEARSAAALREAQRLTMGSCRNTGMAVVSDIATVRDIHPPNKHEVGRRLALWALAHDYGSKGLPFSGPLPLKATREGPRVRLTFEHADLGLATRDGKPPSHFEIAGPDGKFLAAEARIEGRSVIVWAGGIDAPAQVRFGYWDDAEPNLANGAGLPASPFLLALR